MTIFKQLAHKKSTLVAVASTLLFLTACQKYSEEDFGSDTRFKTIYPEGKSTLDVSESALPIVTSIKTTDVFKARIHSDYMDSAIVVINGTQFPLKDTEFFTKTSSHIHTEMYNLRGAFTLGANVISFKAENGVESPGYEFFFDDYIPRLNINAVYDSAGGKTVQPQKGQAYVFEGDFGEEPSAIKSLSFSQRPIDVVYKDDNGDVVATTELASSFEVTMPSYEGVKNITYTVADVLGQTRSETLIPANKSLSTMMAVQINNSMLKNVEPLANELMLGLCSMLEGEGLVNSGVERSSGDKPCSSFKRNKKVPYEVLDIDDEIVNINDTFIPREGELSWDGWGLPGTCPLRAKNGRTVTNCYVRISRKPDLINPTVSFGFDKSDRPLFRPDELKSYMDIHLKKLEVHVAIIAVDGDKYQGAYKIGIVLDNVVLRKYVKAFKDGNQLIGTGAPSAFILRYDNELRQKISDMLYSGALRPKLYYNVDDNIRSRAIENVVKFFSNYGFYKRKAELISKIEANIDKTLSPAIEDVLSSMPSMKGLMGMATTQGAISRIDTTLGRVNNEPVDVPEDAPHLQQTLSASYVRGYNKAGLWGKNVAARLKFKGAYQANSEEVDVGGFSTLNAAIGSVYHDPSKFKALDGKKRNGEWWARKVDGKLLGKEVDMVYAITPNAINQFLMVQHQLGFLAAKDLKFTMTPAFDSVGGTLDALNFNNFYSRFFTNSIDTLIDGVDEGREYEVSITTHQPPQLKFVSGAKAIKTIELPSFIKLYVNDDRKGDDSTQLVDADASLVKVILPDVQIKMDLEGDSKPELDINVDVELEVYVAVNNGMPVLIPKGDFVHVRLKSIQTLPASVSDIPGIVSQSYLEYIITSNIDNMLRRDIEGKDQLNVLFGEWMRSAAVVESMQCAGDNSGKMTLPSLASELGLSEVALPFSSVFGEMKSAVLYEPVFRWLRAEKKGGWLTVGLDFKVSRPEQCPQFKGSEDGDGYYNMPDEQELIDRASPLSFCVQAETINDLECEML